MSRSSPCSPPRRCSAQAATPAASPAPAPAPLSITGLLFGSYNFTPSTTPNQLNNQNDNGFILDRAYLNFRAPAGDHMSIRVTTDVYQTSEATPNAYTIRAKYAYLQYDGTKSASGMAFMGRIGILQNVVIDHEETFWPRYLSQTAVERAGYFSSADGGIAAGLTLPDKMGEVYSTIVNGSSYTSRENNRFKDYAIRLSLTPLASHTDAGVFQTFTISPWIYKGALASALREWRCRADRRRWRSAGPEPLRALRGHQGPAAGDRRRVRASHRRRGRGREHHRVAAHGGLDVGQPALRVHRLPPARLLERIGQVRARHRGALRPREADARAPTVS